MLATDAGGWRQINRAGYPMIWPIFWPDDTRFTNPANTRHPSEDVDAVAVAVAVAVAKGIAEQVATVVAANGTSSDPHGYGRGSPGRCSPTFCPTSWRHRPATDLTFGRGSFRVCGSFAPELAHLR